MGRSSTTATSPGGQSICFIHTSPAMVHLLTGAGPDAMGGAELQMYLLGRELGERGWDVSYIVGDYGQPDSHSTNGFRLESIQTGGRSEFLGTAKALCRFWQALANVDADVYVTRGLTAQTGVVTGFARARGRHSLFWFGKNSDATYAVPQLSGLPVSERVPAWFGMRYASAVVCQTTQQLELLRTHTGRSGVLIRNVTPWQGMPPADQASGPVLWVGSIQPKKRPEMLLEVAAQLPDVAFTMIGGKMRGHERLHETTVARVAQVPNVRYLGFVPHTEIARFFEAASMLVSTSDGEHEGFPNVFLQAWSLGLPVAATCDPDGLIGEHGLGRTCSSAAELVQAIDAFRGRSGLREPTAARARAYVQRHHSAERVGEQLAELLGSLQGVDAIASADGAVRV